MNLILLSGPNGSGRIRHLNLGHPAALTAAVALVLCVLAAPFAIGLQMGKHAGSLDTSDPGRLRHLIDQERDEISRLKADVSTHTDAIAAHLSTLSAHLVHVDSLGKRLTLFARINNPAFNFDDEPISTVSGNTDLSTVLSDLEYRTSLRETQLIALGNILNQRLIEEATRPGGSPVTTPVVSSPFGWRKDPVNGEDERFHEGVDLSGTAGQSIEAVAAGVVTRAGWEGGYGNLVEINHGNGYLTRYAHNQQALVTVGQTVTRGDHIALMGSTGHSTGPHVHFEVLHNGTQIDPLIFVKR